MDELVHFWNLGKMQNFKSLWAPRPYAGRRSTPASLTKIRTVKGWSVYFKSRRHFTMTKLSSPLIIYNYLRLLWVTLLFSFCWLHFSHLLLDTLLSPFIGYTLITFLWVIIFSPFLRLQFPPPYLRYSFLHLLLDTLSSSLHGLLLFSLFIGYTFLLLSIPRLQGKLVSPWYRIHGWL